MRGTSCGVWHKMQGMVDAQNKRCEQAGCSKQPLFNFEGEDMARFCVQHKVQGMVDVNNSMCKHAGCGNDGDYYYFDGELRVRF